jgi:hypothetical protein
MPQMQSLTQAKEGKWKKEKAADEYRITRASEIWGDELGDLE